MRWDGARRPLVPAALLALSATAGWTQHSRAQRPRAETLGCGRAAAGFAKPRISAVSRTCAKPLAARPHAPPSRQKRLRPTPMGRQRARASPNQLPRSSRSAARSRLALRAANRRPHEGRPPLPLLPEPSSAAHTTLTT